MSNTLSGQNLGVFPYNLDGTQNIDVVSINGQTFDPSLVVPYIGATGTINAGAQKIQTSAVPVANNDVVNLLALSNAVLYVEGISAANFVPYTGATGNTSLGTNKITSSATPSTGNDLTNKTYVDTQDALRVPYTGSISSLNLGSNAITATTAQFTSITSATPSLALGVDGIGNLRSFPVPTTTNLLPLNNTWTGTNTFNNNLTTGDGYDNNFGDAVYTGVNPITSGTPTTTGISAAAPVPLPTISF
jgi:hypothetical protein